MQRLEWVGIVGMFALTGSCYYCYQSSGGDCDCCCHSWHFYCWLSTWMGGGWVIVMVRTVQ